MRGRIFVVLSAPASFMRDYNISDDADSSVISKLSLVALLGISTDSLLA